jgi:hypothetical protein
VSLIAKEDNMSLKTLAEAIMLQAAEDFLGEDRHEEDVAFFSGDGFRICSELAGMDHSEKCSFLDLVRGSAPVRCAAERKVAAGGSQRVLHV